MEDKKGLEYDHLRSLQETPTNEQHFKGRLIPAERKRYGKSRGGDKETQKWKESASKKEN